MAWRKILVKISPFEKYCNNDQLNAVAQPNYLAGTFTCGPPNEPPTETNLALNSSQPVVMCLGQQARYICEAGGINIREVGIK